MSLDMVPDAARSVQQCGYTAAMFPATAWDDPDARAWNVMGTLRDRQQLRAREAREARRRVADPEIKLGYMTAALAAEQYKDAISVRWKGGPTVLAFLFAQPDSDAMRMLDTRGKYFDMRSGDTWDLFFPGYYRSSRDQTFEINTGARPVTRTRERPSPVGRSYTADWYFSARDFDMLRRHVEESSGQRWQYSGGTDLVLINGWLPDRGEPSIDWVSTISGQVTDQADGTRTLTLANIVERISRDVETVAEDSAYGVGEVTNEPIRSNDGHNTRDFMINALGGIAAALGAKALGI
jgi:hypothetical protein